MKGGFGAFKIKFLLTCAGTLLYLCGMAQLKSEVTRYTTNEGLSHDGVLCITRDHDGFMWFGTFDGINRFDGYKFVVYKSKPGDSSNLRSNKIRNIVEDKAGYLWIQTFDYKIYRFDKKTEQFLPVSDGPYKPLFKDQVIADKIIPDSVTGVWLLSKNQGIYYMYCNASGLPVVNQYTGGNNQPLSIKGYNIAFQCTDTNGRVWVGTEAGLNCLQRKRSTDYQVVKFTPAVERLLSGQAFTCAAQTPEAVYFGTQNGLLLTYHMATRKISVSNLGYAARLNAICVSKTGVLYIATDGKGLIRLNPATGSIAQSAMRGNAGYQSLYEDRHGNIWIEPEHYGVIKYNPYTGAYKSFTQRKDFTAASRDYLVVTDASGTLWISMKGGGFGYYDEAADDIKYFFDEPGSADQKFSNVVTSLYADKTGVVWMSAKDGGINKIVTPNDKFNFRRLVARPQNRSENDVRAMMTDSRKRLWVCTKDSLVHIYNAQGDELNIFANSSNRIGFVYSVMEDSKGNIWLGTKGNGLFKATPANAQRSTYTLQNYKNDAGNLHSLSSNLVYSVIEDRKGRIWVGTFGGGLNLLSSFNGKTTFKNYFNAFGNYPFSWAKVVRHLCEDDKGMIWVATSYGLLVFNPDDINNGTYKFKSYQKIPGDAHSLGNNSVQYICKDNNGQMWVGTFGGGLNKVISPRGDIKHLKFKAFTTEHGLPNDVVLSMTVDRQNNLWVATAGGLSKFDTRRQIFKNYDAFDGLPKVSFSEATCFTAPNGQLYFGCLNGYLHFSPQTVIHKRAGANIALTNMQLYYKDILPGVSGSPLQYAINETQVLTLNHNQNVISIDYAVLDYRAVNKVSYAYKLEGFDKTWHFVNDLRKATYTNIPPGQYTFQVKGTSDDLFTSVPQKTFRIIIKQPFYLTIWAYIIYLILAVLAVMLARNIILTMIRLRNKVVVEQKLTEVKLSFFTNISHELRTPLTLIASPLEELSLTENLSAKGKEYFKIVNRNVNRMIRFTNQLLDFRKIQSGKMQISVAETDLIALAKEVGTCFSTIAAEKNIAFNIRSQKQALHAWVDAEKIEIILYNLLSNAFKFSPPGKRVTLEVESLPEINAVEMRVIDEGEGVPAGKLEEIFEIYHEEQTANDKHLKGTGIGLALAKGLAASHKGRLWAQHNTGGGMVFILQLKAGHDHFTQAEIQPPQSSFAIEHVRDSTVPAAHNPQVHNPADAEAPQVLIVEDNPDLRTFLEIKLSSFYRVLNAEDGAQGLKIAREFCPDLIISDVLMPNMDGIQMLDALKHDHATSHIPVILLTAKSSIESRINGLKYGADIYMSKPFHNELLLASIENLLTSRKRLFEQLAGTRPVSNVPFEPDAPVTTSKDEEFLKEVIKIVEERMKDPVFNIDEVAAGMGMGRTTFYKKLKTLSALSPVEFVREMRLKRSKILLDTALYTVSEAGYMAGFNSLPYFSTCFKDKYHISPSAYLKKAKEAHHH